MDRGGQAAQKATTCDLNGTSIPYAIERGNLAELRNAVQASNQNNKIDCNLVSSPCIERKS